MKKLLILFLVCILFQAYAEAKDYAKLHEKEMKHAQKYGTTNKHFNSYAPNVTVNTNSINGIKAPKILKIGNYQEIPEDKYKEKMAKDKKDYDKIAKSFDASKTDNYHGQAYNSDFYQLYRVAEKIIRANNLDYINWRITVARDTSFNASSSNMNNITINTGLFDTLSSNDDALALVIGHEMGHALLGHQARQARTWRKIKRLSVMQNSGLATLAVLKKLTIDAKNMEYAADIEGAKLISKAGFDLTNARETINFIASMDDDLNRWFATHPSGEDRIKNYEENRVYFVEDEWRKQGRYNLYYSTVLSCQKSSDRKSIVISKGESRNPDLYYRPETMVDLYKRYGYKSYLKGDFKDAIKYFKKVLDEDRGDYAVYLYTSYAYEYLGDKESAKEFAGYAQTLAPNNQYVKEQIENL